LSGTKGLAFDAAGNLYITDSTNNRIQMVAATTCSSSCAFGLASTTANDIYTVAGSSSGTSGHSGDSGAATSALLSAPKGVAFDAGGDLYIADGGNNRIQEVSATTTTQWGVSMTADDIYTVAGSSSGSSGSSGDGGVATSALFSTPGGIATDPGGDLFITDEANNEVREVTANALPTTALSPDDVYSILGTGASGTSGDNAQATEAEMDSPISSAVDASGNVYVADEVNNRIQEVAGTTHTQWGISMTAGDVYTIAGSSSGSSGHSGDAGAATSALLDGPTGVAVDGAGDLYIADQTNNRIQEVAATTGTQWGISMTANDIYTVAGSSSGTSGHSGDSGAATSALLDQPRNLTLDASGNLYIADTTNNRVQVVAKSTCSSGCPFGLSSTTANDIYTIAGSSSGTSGSTGDGGAATSALLSGTKGLAFDAAGNLYITDSTNNRIQMVAATTCSSSCAFGLASTTANDIYTVAGSSSGTSGHSGDSGAATSALLSAPKGVAFDAGGDLYIADGGNNRIQEVSATTTTQWGVSMTADDIYTVAGSSSGSSGSSGDGGVATSALFSTPGGIATDPGGDLFITDEANNEVREVVHNIVAEYGYTTAGSVSHLLNDVTDSLNNVTSFTYTTSSCPASASDCVSTMTDPMSNETTWTYSLNGSGTGTVLVDALSNTETQYGINQYDLNSETDAYGTAAAALTETTLYPATGQPFIVRQPTGGLTVSYFDVNGNTTASIDAQGDLTTTQYNSLDEPLISTSPKGEVTTDTFNTDGDLTSSTQPIPGGGSAVTTYTYTDSLHPDKDTSMEDPNLHTWDYTYTANGLQASVTDPVGNETTYTYNSLNEKVTMVSPRGNVMGGTPANFTTTYSYDSNGNLVETTDPLGYSTSESYDALGQKVSSTDANGNITTYAYNTDGELATETEPNGATLSYTYFPSGNKQTSTDADGKTTNYTYDDRGDLLTQTDPLTHVTTYTYDGNGNKTSMTDPDGNVTTYVYNNANQLISQTDGYGTSAAITLTYTYDADGNKTSYTDGKGNTTTYAYNALNQLTSSTDPLGKTTSYTYDDDGNMATETNPDSQTTTWAYNNDDKVTGISYSDGLTHSVSYSYDADGNVYQMVDASGTSTYTYFDNDRLDTYENGAGVTITYGYDPVGNVTSIEYASGKTVTQSFNAMNELATVTDWNSNSTSFTYDADGNQLTTSYPNGIVDTNVYNNASQLTSMTDKLSATTVVEFQYTPDNDGLTTSETDTDTPGAGTFSDTYNSLQEVTASNTESYSYDAGMNLTEAPSGNTQGFNADDEVCFSGTGSGTCGSPPSGATVYTYSNEGYRTATTPSSGTSYTYGWTEANQMKSVTPSVGNATSYIYDGNSLLQSETTASTTTDFTWNVQPSVPLMLSDGTNYYIYGTGIDPIEQIAVSGGATSYLLSDQLASTRAITNSSGTVTGSVTYDAWGNETGTSGSITTPFLFAGEYLDSPSGFYYLRARWFDPQTGEFVSVDPAQQATHTPYAYGGNDPLNESDPSGMVAFTPKLVGASTIYGCVGGCKPACTSGGVTYLRAGGGQVCLWVANVVISAWNESRQAGLTPKESFSVAFAVDCAQVWFESSLSQCEETLLDYGGALLYESGRDDSVNWLVSQVGVSNVNAAFVCLVGSLGPTVLNPIAWVGHAMSSFASAARSIIEDGVRKGAECI
jgi:RHS repeat-associated protein